ncbi:unnamed protein product [Sphagnum jensenii]|uniref:Uncharacterized protein n=1 Tax=Sphagnum jensenii TaxID=128206 RepID=A0ABP1BCJ5_9BRYO
MVLFKEAGAMVSEGVDTVVVEEAATLVSVGEQQSLPDCLHIDVQKRKFKIQTNNLHQPACALLVAMMGIYAHVRKRYEKTNSIILMSDFGY